MILHREKEVVQCAPEYMYEAIIDIESYPEFVPGCHAAQVKTREKGVLHVDQQFGIGPMVLNFTSRAQFCEHEQIVIHAQDGPFRKLEIEWLLADAGATRCTVELLIQADLTSLPLQKMIKPVLAISSHSIISLFEQRARLQEQIKQQDFALP